MIPVFGEGVRFQWRKPLDRFTMFKDVRLRDGHVYDVGTAVYRQLEPTLAAPWSRVLNQRMYSTVTLSSWRLLVDVASTTGVQSIRPRLR